MSTIATPTARFSELTTVEVGRGPHAHIGYVKEAGEVWVSNTRGRTISVLDHSSGELKATWDIGAGPGHFSFDAGCRVGCVALRDSDAVAIVDPLRREVLGRVALPNGSAPLGTMPAFDRGQVYTLNPGNATVTSIDMLTRRVTAVIPVGGDPMWGQPWGSSYKPITKPVGKTYVVSKETDDLTVFDDRTNQALRRVQVGAQPNRNAIFREHDTIYTSNEGDDTVSVVSIETDEVVATVPVGRQPFRMLPVLAMSGKDEMWVLEAGGQVSALCGTTHTLTRTIDVIDSPANWVVNAQRQLFVVASKSRQMVVLDLESDRLVGFTELTHDPEPGAISGLIYTAANRLFILNDDNTVTVLKNDAA